MNLYPVNLNIQGKTCVIVGGGEVALRKIGPLLSCGARIVLISPIVVSDIEKMASLQQIRWINRGYKPGDLQDAFLVFAATDSREVQQAVVEEAEGKGILVNSADDPAACSFQVPARVRRGNFLLTVSTGGGSPALAAKLRRELAEEYGEEYQQFVELLARIREKVVDDGNSSEAHKQLFEKVLELNILEFLRDGDWKGLRQGLENILPDEIDVEDLLRAIRFFNGASK